ncbi:MAG: hypothetical protein SNJ29_10205 [Rikenellaceae bacterium]
MKVNIAEIGCMGGCVHLPFEPNTPDIPELDGGVVVESMLFDGVGVCEYNDKYYVIKYPKLEEVEGDEQVRRTVNQHRYGYRLPDNFDIGVDDMALTFGNIEECEHSEYVSYLVEGLINHVNKMMVEDGEREVLSINDYSTRLREIEKCPPKYLYLFAKLKDFSEEFEGKVFSVSDDRDNHICDVLQDDLAELENQGIIDNNATLTSEEHRAILLATRFEVIVFLKEK